MISTVTASPPIFSEPPVTVTITQQGGGVKPAVVGGIAAGIVGGFLLLGTALAFFVFSRKKAPEDGGARGYYREEQSPSEPKGERFGSINSPEGRFGV